jgi:hypothetical protein
MSLFDNLFGNKKESSIPSGPPPGEFPPALVVARGDAMQDSFGTTR